MIKIYITMTIICFISLKASLFITSDNWHKLSCKHNGFIKRNLFTLMICLIPFFRIIMVSLALIIGILLGNDEFCKQIKERMKNDG